MEDGVQGHAFVRGPEASPQPPLNFPTKADMIEQITHFQTTKQEGYLCPNIHQLQKMKPKKRL